MQNNSVNEGIFRFLGARIWTPMPVYRYENPSGYVTDILVSKTITVKTQVEQDSEIIEKIE